MGFTITGAGGEAKVVCEIDCVLVEGICGERGNDVTEGFGGEKGKHEERRSLLIAASLLLCLFELGFARDIEQVTFGRKVVVCYELGD